MKDGKYPQNKHKAYHAHIYFDELTTDKAKELCADIASNFTFPIGRFHEKLVGPHPKWSCQITFGANDFDEFIPWLNGNKEQLTIFIHGLTGDDLKDHTVFAYWLGQSVELNLDMFMVK